MFVLWNVARRGRKSLRYLQSEVVLDIIHVLRDSNPKHKTLHDEFAFFHRRHIRIPFDSTESPLVRQGQDVSQVVCAQAYLGNATHSKVVRQ